jgi:hypothetical protein
MPPSEEELLLQGRDLIARTTEAHRARWGFGTPARWTLDQRTGTITWTFPDHTAEAPAQVLGSLGADGTWMWAWANHTLFPPLRDASERVRAWGEANAQGSLATPTFPLTEPEADDLAALATRLLRAPGLHRPHAGNALLYLTFGDVTITHPDGRTETFTPPTACPGPRSGEARKAEAVAEGEAERRELAADEAERRRRKKKPS